MTIFIRTSGGGGIVLLVALVLIFGHGSGIGGALAAVLVALVVVIALAAVALGVYLLRRVRAEQAAGRPPIGPTVVRISPEPGDLPARAPALEAPAVRLHPDQLEQLAEIIRRGQRPEQ